MRDRTRGVRVLLVAAATSILVACSAGSAATAPTEPVGSGPVPSSAHGSDGPAASSPPPPLTSPATGVVVDVQSSGIADIRGFSIRLPGGRIQAFRVGQLEGAAGFPPQHLAEHRASGEPVRVYFRPDGDELVAYRLEDADH